MVTFGQHPKVGLSGLPIDKDLMENLLTEKDIRDHFRLTDKDIPLEEAVVNMSNQVHIDDNADNDVDDDVDNVAKTNNMSNHVHINDNADNDVDDDADNGTKRNDEGDYDDNGDKE